MRPPPLGGCTGRRSMGLETLAPNVSRVCRIFGGFDLDAFGLASCFDCFAMCLRVFCCFEPPAILACLPCSRCLSHPKVATDKNRSQRGVASVARERRSPFDFEPPTKARSTDHADSRPPLDTLGPAQRVVSRPPRKCRTVLLSQFQDKICGIYSCDTPRARYW